MKRVIFVAMTIAGLVSAAMFAQTPTTALATVKIPLAVLADGKPLAPGTYDLRLAPERPPVVAGQAPEAERWVEFVKTGAVAGRELATVVPEADIDTIAKGPRPKPNQSRVDVLKGEEYVRVWVNRNGSHYLINLPLSR